MLCISAQSYKKNLDRNVKKNINKLNAWNEQKTVSKISSDGLIVESVDGNSIGWQKIEKLRKNQSRIGKSQFRKLKM